MSLKSSPCEEPKSECGAAVLLAEKKWIKNARGERKRVAPVEGRNKVVCLMVGPKVRPCLSWSYVQLFCQSLIVGERIFRMSRTSNRRDFLRARIFRCEKRMERKWVRARGREKVVRLSDAIEDVIKNAQREERRCYILILLAIRAGNYWLCIKFAFWEGRERKRTREGERDGGKGENEEREDS